MLVVRTSWVRTDQELTAENEQILNGPCCNKSMTLCHLSTKETYGKRVVAKEYITLLGAICDWNGQLLLGDGAARWGWGGGGGGGAGVMFNLHTGLCAQ